MYYFNIYTMKCKAKPFKINFNVRFFVQFYLFESSIYLLLWFLSLVVCVKCLAAWRLNTLFVISILQFSEIAFDVVIESMFSSSLSLNSENNNDFLTVCWLICVAYRLNTNNIVLWWIIPIRTKKGKKTTKTTTTTDYVLNNFMKKKIIQIKRMVYVRSSNIRWNCMDHIEEEDTKRVNERKDLFITLYLFMLHTHTKTTTTTNHFLFYFCWTTHLYNSNWSRSLFSFQT